jgi:hypothetical protein
MLEKLFTTSVATAMPTPSPMPLTAGSRALDARQAVLTASAMNTSSDISPTKPCSVKVFRN